MCAASSHGRDDVVVLRAAPEFTAGRGVDIGADVSPGPHLRVPFLGTIDRSGVPAQQDAEYRVLARRPTTPRIDGVSRRWRGGVDYTTRDDVAPVRHRRDARGANPPRNRPAPRRHEIGAFEAALKRMSPLLELVIIDRAEDDLGPATKLLPALKRETNPSTRLVTVDDVRTRRLTGIST